MMVTLSLSLIKTIIYLVLFGGGFWLVFYKVSLIRWSPGETKAVHRTNAMLVADLNDSLDIAVEAADGQKTYEQCVVVVYFALKKKECLQFVSVICCPCHEHCLGITQPLGNNENLLPSAKTV